MTMTQLLLLIMAVTIFLASLVVLAAFSAQLIVLALTQRRLRPLRWATAAVPAVALCCARLTESVIWAGAAVSLFLGWGLAWFAYKRICGGDRPSEPDPQGKNANETGHA